METEFESGAAMYAHEFEKNYSVESIAVRDSKIVVRLSSGNKLTGSAGGMLLTDDLEVANKVRK